MPSTKLGVVSVGRTKLAMAVAGAVLVLLGVVAAVTMRSDGGRDRVDTVAASEAPGHTPTSVGAAPATASDVTPTTKAPGAPTITGAPSRAPATATTPPSVPRTPQEVQQFIAGMTAQLQAATATDGSTAPVTKEQIEARVRAQLKLLGINL